MAGMKVVPVKALEDGSLDLEDLRAKAEKHKDNLAAFMVCRSFLGIQHDLNHSIFLDHLSFHIWSI